MRKKTTTTKKSSNSLFGKIARWVGKAILFFFVFSLVWVLAYKFINPPITFLMVQRNWERKAAGKPTKLKKEWVNFEDISDNMKRAAVTAEDQLFLKHMGFDIGAIENAYESNLKGTKKRVIGGSTISQQTAKNVFLWPGRSYVRKAFEAYFTLMIEVLWSKERILEVYLNVIEMGDGIYGAEAAAQKYYGHSCRKMTRSEAALLAACFPNPIRWNPNKATPYIQKKKYFIMRSMRRLGPLDF